MSTMPMLRACSLGAAALIAAALGDPLVESVSNTGLFGPGFHDNVHTSVIPALAAGLAIVVVAIVASLLGSLDRAREPGDDWVAALARDTLARSPMRSFPAVFAAQLAALYAMEHVESLLLIGTHVTNGASWLGGPVALSLLVHGALCFATLKIFGSAMRGALTALAALLAIAAAYVALLGREATATFRRRTEEYGIARAQGPHVRQCGGRAPPLPATPSHAFAA